MNSFIMQLLTALMKALQGSNTIDNSLKFNDSISPFGVEHITGLHDSKFSNNA